MIKTKPLCLGFTNEGMQAEAVSDGFGAEEESLTEWAMWRSAEFQMLVWGGPEEGFL